MKELSISRLGGVRATRHCFERLSFESEMKPSWCVGCKDSWWVYLGYLIIRYGIYMKLNRRRRPRLYCHALASRSSSLAGRSELKLQWYAALQASVSSFYQRRATWADCLSAVKDRLVSGSFGQYTTDEYVNQSRGGRHLRSLPPNIGGWKQRRPSADWYKQRWLKDYMRLPVAYRREMNAHIDWQWIGQHNCRLLQRRHKYVGEIKT